MGKKSCPSINSNINVFVEKHQSPLKNEKPLGSNDDREKDAPILFYSQLPNKWGGGGRGGPGREGRVRNSRKI